MYHAGRYKLHTGSLFFTVIFCNFTLLHEFVVLVICFLSCVGSSQIVCTRSLSAGACSFGVAEAAKSCMFIALGRCLQVFVFLSCSPCTALRCDLCRGTAHTRRSHRAAIHVRGRDQYELHTGRHAAQSASPCHSPVFTAAPSQEGITTRSTRHGSVASLASACAPALHTLCALRDFFQQTFGQSAAFWTSGSW